MSEKVFDFTNEKMEQMRQAAAKFREEIAGYFKDMNVEITEWRFAVGKTEEGHTVDAAVKLLVKKKK